MKNKFIFIIGISPRSGTNYLYNLLNLHPRISPSKINGEGFLVYYSDLLDNYTSALARRWHDNWENDPKLIQEAIGKGLTDSLGTDNDYNTIKTPLTTNLDNLKKFFPDSKVILLMRDGKNVVASHEKTFKKGISIPSNIYSIGGETILNHINDQQFYCLKYEDLNDDPENQLESIFAYLDLSYSDVDQNEIGKLGIVGSSTFGRSGDQVDWNQTFPKTKNFNPNNRSANWSNYKRQRFDWIAGDINEKLGYKRDEISFKLLYLIPNVIMDLIYKMFYHAKTIYWSIRKYINLYNNLFRQVKGG